MPRSAAELAKLKAKFKKHFHDPHAAKEAREGRDVVGLNEAFDEFVRTLDAMPHARPAWEDEVEERVPTPGVKTSRQSSRKAAK